MTGTRDDPVGSAYVTSDVMANSQAGMSDMRDYESFVSGARRSSAGGTTSSVPNLHA